ncbi:hypothetical protein RB614_28345 [Phytohabitans sp. ZYX-F-186]|uniref:Secreted protein n=1 Tax=Phytohabitans maris TaxID=3071409 RepID=A0ABU0ZN35_9ACTN|nr:hypothetical protein [Phytohabitans sp. ZYX-F-186]MDQ7908445.1 hypothetical protein [Phytohabitans sp. ZYX-F-186]
MTTLVREPATRAPAAAPAARLRRRAAGRFRGTPGRLVLATVALVVLGLATGVAGVVGVRQRADLVDGAVARSGELAVAAQRLYRALSDADATAASAFLTGGVEPATLRERYQTDIAQAAAALAVVSGGGAGDGRGANAVARIAAQLPVYTGLVETARVYNRQGVPVGGAYLREASGVMRERLLPAAQELYTAVSEELDEARGDAGAFPWFAVALGVLTIAALVVVQRFLTRRTNRVFNIGLVAATVAAVAVVLWLGVSALVAAGRLEASHDRGSEEVARLADARIAALQARADESLTLVARGNGQAFEEDYDKMMDRLAGNERDGGLLVPGDADGPTREALTAALTEARNWDSAHQQVRKLDNDGQYAQAVTASVGAEQTSTATIANRLDERLAAAIDHNSENFRQEARGAAGALSGADIGIGLLAALLVLGAAAGIQRRLAEYR